ncbi:RASEF protein, partial [Nothoprocta ornata]|nr:RASEF protein [Nothoprocta ornata]
LGHSRTGEVRAPRGSGCRAGPGSGCSSAQAPCSPVQRHPVARFRSIARSYFRKAHGILLLYDISNQSSFLGVRQWIKDIKAGAGTSVSQAHSALFCETSAKDGTNVVEAVLHLAR